MNNHEIYRNQVALLLRIIPFVAQIEQFAVHGGTAINLFCNNMPRYSVDIDITYLPIADRATSLTAINNFLYQLKQTLQMRIPGIQVIHKPDVWKLLCSYNQAVVKIEVNGTKRGALGELMTLPLCQAAEQEFYTTCRARIVSFSQLYGGKLAAALSRQHPRDLFDYKYMSASFNDIRDGLLLALLGSDKPIIESLVPNPINQQNALEQQFFGMTNLPFTYDDYENTRRDLQHFVRNGLTTDDKRLLLSFEQGNPDWTLCSIGDASIYPAVQWKLQNINRLKKQNPNKFSSGIDKLASYLSI